MSPQPLGFEIPFARTIGKEVKQQRFRLHPQFRTPHALRLTNSNHRITNHFEKEFQGQNVHRGRLLIPVKSPSQNIYLERFSTAPFSGSDWKRRSQGAFRKKTNTGRTFTLIRRSSLNSIFGTQPIGNGEDCVNRQLLAPPIPSSALGPYFIYTAVSTPTPPPY